MDDLFNLLFFETDHGRITTTTLGYWVGFILTFLILKLSRYIAHQVTEYNDSTWGAFIFSILLSAVSWYGIFVALIILLVLGGIWLFELIQRYSKPKWL